MTMSACRGSSGGVLAARTARTNRASGPGHQAAESRNRCRTKWPGPHLPMPRSPLCRGAGDRREAGGGHEEALHSLAGHLASLIVSEVYSRCPL